MSEPQLFLSQIASHLGKLERKALAHTGVSGHPGGHVSEEKGFQC
jgi:hypothetical protein